jgi:hypothetical protein
LTNWSELSEEQKKQTKKGVWALIKIAIGIAIIGVVLSHYIH